MSHDQRSGGNAYAVAMDGAGIAGFLAGALVFSAAVLWTADAYWRLHITIALENAGAELSPILELKEPGPAP
jgi:hypothetical protein